jgi:predicted esterase
MKTTHPCFLAGILLAATAATAIAAAPQIKPTTALQHTAVDIGQTNTFAVTATVEALSYQWRLDGRDLPSQTNATLTFTAAQPSDEGDYTVEVRNSEGAVVSEPTRLWVVPTAANFIKGNYTNSTGQRLPYFYLLPANYDAGRSYPLVCLFHGAPGHEDMITNAVPAGPGYANMPALKTVASYRQQTRDPVILFWPTRRTGDGSWTDDYLRLVSGMLDKLLTEFNVDTNRIYVGGGSEGVHAAWDIIGMRPGFFAGAFLASGGRQANTAAAFIKDVPIWFWCAADDSPRLGVTQQFVNALRQAGGNAIYTEYTTGGHLGGIFMGFATPALIDWLLAQRRGAPSLGEPLLSITSPTLEETRTTGASSVSLAGSAAALGQSITQVRWTNTVNQAGGVADGTNLWTAQGIPLAAYEANLIIVTATTTSWASGYGGNTTFNDTLTVVCLPIWATLAVQGDGLILNWSGGLAPFEVQRATDLSIGDWTGILTNAVPPLSLPVDGQPGFFRVIGY